MNDFIEAAYRYAIITEKKSYDFYCRMARTVSDNRIKNLFDQLAQEEAEHVKSFVMRYPGDEFDLLALVNSHPQPDGPAYWASVASTLNGALNEEQALEISLHEELDCLETYAAMVTCIKEPSLRALFEFAMDDSRQHYAKISDEYRRIKGGDLIGVTPQIQPQQPPPPCN